MMAVLCHTACVCRLLSQGIGLEFANQLLEKGNTVVAAVRSPVQPTGCSSCHRKRHQASCTSQHWTLQTLTASSSGRQICAAIALECIMWMCSSIMQVGLQLMVYPLLTWECPLLKHLHQLSCGGPEVAVLRVDKWLHWCDVML